MPRSRSRPHPGATHLHVTYTRAATSDEPIATATIVADEMQHWLRQIEGFEGFLMLSRPGETVGLSFWASREVAERNRAARRELVERVTAVAGVRIEEVVDYEVTFADLRALAVGSSE